MCYFCLVAHLRFYVPDDVAEGLRERARSEGVSLSCFLAALAKKEVENRWPEGYFDEVIGSWEGELTRPAQIDIEQREQISPHDAALT